MNEELQHFGLRGGQSEPFGCRDSYSCSHFTVIFFVTLAQVVQQQSEMQRLLVLDRTVYLAQHAVFPHQLIRVSYRAERMLVDRVFVIVVELQQIRCVMKFWNNFGEYAHVVQSAQDSCRPRRLRE